MQSSSLTLNSATVAPPSTSRIYSPAQLEIGRFALTARDDDARVQSIVVNNIGTANLQSISNSISSARLIDISAYQEISATATISGNTITFSSMSDTITKDTTKNYAIKLDVASVEPYYGKTITLATSTGGIMAVRSADSTAIIPTGTSSTKTYTLGVVSPIVMVTPINENIFKVRITNPDTNT